MTRHPLDAEIARVVDTGRCSGCGVCCQIDSGLTMALDAEGFLRPERLPTAGDDDGAAVRGETAVAEFRATCPGIYVRRSPAPGTTVDPTIGPALGVWRAWAVDPEIRRTGSSGGTLTALSAWLVESGEAVHVLGATQGDDPRRTVPVRITSRAEALDAAGSRYAPAATAASHGALDPAGAVVGKPCEASALRALAEARHTTAPVILSFFCAGTPSQHATDSLVKVLGMPDSAELTSLRYRGNGWPGRFVARAADGTSVSAGYDESWGEHLGPTVQWRCKLCVDGVGESADITAGDLWHTDERGYPSFTEGDGESALVARTARGAEIVCRAVEAGVIEIEPITSAEVAGVQPLQRRRRATLLGRMIGTRLAGRPTPRYRGFGLLRLAVAAPRETLRTARGTYRRVRASGTSGAAR